MKILPKQPNQSVIDGIRCLQGVVSHPGPIGVSELAEDLGLETTRVHRLLRTLAHMGLLCWTEKRKYAPGPALPVLATQTLHASGFYKAIGPLEALHAELNVITAMGVLWGRSVSYLFHADPDQPLSQAIGSFGLWPATEAGLGIALLALQPVEKVISLYQGGDIPMFKNLDGLLKKLEKVRTCGYTQHNNTLALVIEGPFEAAFGVSSPDIGPKTVSRYLPVLERCRENILKEFGL
jgi:DNA-binding IclR family transcriptional regulator